VAASAPEIRTRQRKSTNITILLCTHLGRLNPVDATGQDGDVVTEQFQKAMEASPVAQSGVANGTAVLRGQPKGRALGAICQFAIGRRANVRSGKRRRQRDDAQRRQHQPFRMGEIMEILGWIVFLFLLFLVLSSTLGSFFTVNTAQVAIVTRFGKFLRVAEPGLNWKWPFIDGVASRISLRVNQITLTMETKTKDNVFVTIPISVQNRVRPEKVFDAYYKLSDPTAQIKSYVEQVILGHVPGMTLDEVFASQSGIAAAVKQELDADMAGFGYEIVNVLVTDIVPDAKVKSAMNDINAAQREQVAATARGEAEKILVVKKAEAEAASKALQGQGIANQRRAIIEGLQGSIEQFKKGVGGTSTSEVMQLVLVTQYFDTIKSIGEMDKTNTLFLSHSPGAVKDISDQVLQSMLIAERAKA
jgi:regulator of protease activity HflC (stomatin/prohibitin superfamily)